LQSSISRVRPLIVRYEFSWKRAQVDWFHPRSGKEGYQDLCNR
jgi:hypothetical protein